MFINELVIKYFNCNNRSQYNTKIHTFVLKFVQSHMSLLFLSYTIYPINKKKTIKQQKTTQQKKKTLEKSRNENKYHIKYVFLFLECLFISFGAEKPLEININIFKNKIKKTSAGKQNKKKTKS